MTVELQSAIVRILQENGNKVVGAGFLVSNKHILTCAHVINAALKKDLKDANKPDRKISLDFPLVPSGKILKGRIIRWIPVSPNSSILPKTGSDIALLELENTPPEATKPILPIKADNLTNHHFTVFGFPQGKPQGVYTSGIIRGKQSDGRVQVDVSSPTSYEIEPGFSGSPVWDENLKGIVGIIVSFDPLRPNVRSAFIIPTTQLINACLELKEIYTNSIFEERTSRLLERCYQEVEKPGSLLRIKAPWQMGKTTLLSKIVDRFQKKNYKTVFLNLRLFNEQNSDDLEAFLKSFCFLVTKELNIEQNVNDRWNEEMGISLPSQIKCSNYFEKYLLAEDKPLILCLDEVDKIFVHTNIAGQFLGLLRTWHETAKTNKTLQKLRVVLAYTETYTKMPLNQSPFNAGIEIRLPELSPKEVEHLAETYELKLDINQTNFLMETIGGHPYLTKRTFEYFQQQNNFSVKISLEDIIDSGIYDDYLRRYLKYFEQYPDLKKALKKIVTSDRPVGLDSEISKEQMQQLENLGLIKLPKNKAVPRFQLYREYFKDYYWGENL